jgi:hypothetical protein
MRKSSFAPLQRNLFMINAFSTDAAQTNEPLKTTNSNPIAEQLYFLCVLLLDDAFMR